MSRSVNLIQQKFGKLIVLQRMTNDKNGKSRWLCQCDCGNEKIVIGFNLKNKHTRSCGCLAKEKLVARSIRYGHNRVNKESLTYRVWRGIVQRCNNPRNKGYKNYGGRGIIICRKWLKFENFLEDMGKVPIGHQIDRIDNNGNYCKLNCRWTTLKQQARNKRSNHLIAHNGKMQCIATWAEEFHISRDTLSHRLFRGWSTKRALTTPVMCKGNS